MQPRIGRFPVFVGIAAAATAAALLAWWALLALGVGGDDFFGASIVHAGLILPVAVACGAVVGLAAVSSDRRRVDLRRAAAVSLLLLLATGVATIVVWSSVPEPAFSAEDFRSAAAAGDYEGMERQAYRAVEQEALIGLTTAEVRATLGEPSRTGRRSGQWIWELGMINDFMGPGDGGALYLKFDRSRSRVIAAKVDIGAF